MDPGRLIGRFDLGGAVPFGRRSCPAERFVWRIIVRPSRRALDATTLKINSGGINPPPSAPVEIVD
jgi:hypothetical protein